MGTHLLQLIDREFKVEQIIVQGITVSLLLYRLAKIPQEVAEPLQAPFQDGQSHTFFVRILIDARELMRLIEDQVYGLALVKNSQIIDVMTQKGMVRDDQAGLLRFFVVEGEEVIIGPFSY
ncbi:hypothetical protein SDC9_75587 [bioreactor metagenome]|uniref:Uncharacterized protein n=1 Tax=bioreactor metagenome TaxID=1076179 RepID=A0A644YM28_9ZZZZ